MGGLSSEDSCSLPLDLFESNCDLSSFNSHPPPHNCCYSKVPVMPALVSQCSELQQSESHMSILHAQVSQDPQLHNPILPESILQLKLKYFNARSLRSKLSDLHVVLYSHNFDVICVAETWLDPNFNEGLLDPRSYYTVYRRDRLCLNPAGGVMIFVHHRIVSYD